MSSVAYARSALYASGCAVKGEVIQQMQVLSCELAKHAGSYGVRVRPLASPSRRVATRDNRNLPSILPVWHGLTEEDVAEYDPILADVVATTTAGGIEEAARAIAASVLPKKSMHMPPWLRVGGVEGKRWARSVLVHLRAIEMNRPRDPEVHCDLEFDGASGMVTLHPSSGQVPSEVHVSEVVGLRYTVGPAKP